MNARKTTTTLLGTFVLAGLLSAGVASGQPSSTSADYGYGPGYYVVYPRVYPAWGGTTVAGSYARGLAALTHAQGVYNRLTAEARLIHAQAQAKELENRELRIQSYFAMREHNRQARAAERGPRLSAERAAEIAARRGPQRLTAEQLDPATGAIAWPVALQGPEFAELRKVLQAAFAHRAYHGSLSTEQVEQVEQAAEAMRLALKQRIREIPAADYLEAKRFLANLAFEARQPVA